MKSFLLLIATLPLLAACGKQSQASAPTAAQPGKASQIASQAKDAAASVVAEFQKTSNEALAAIDQKLGELKTHAASATNTVKEELDQTLADLDDRRKVLGEKLAALKTEAPEAAQKMIDSLKAELAALKKSAEDAVAKFK